MRDRANRTNSFKPVAGLHLDIIVEIKPIYAKSSEDDILSRCLDGKTQNQNEALNGIFWERLPKGVLWVQKYYSLEFIFYLFFYLFINFARGEKKKHEVTSDRRELTER